MSEARSADLDIAGQWLDGYAGNSRSTYADAIGWPYCVVGSRSGQWRGYEAARQGQGWLAWCHSHGVRLLDARRAHATAWVGALSDYRHPVTREPWSKRSRAQMVSVASSFYAWAIREGRTEINPIAAIDRGKNDLQAALDPTPTRTLSADEARAMIFAADNDPVLSVRLRTSAMIALLFQTGIRVSEMCNAAVADMYEDEGHRLLCATIKGGRKHLFVLPAPTCARVDAYLASRQNAGLLSPALFATSTGHQIRRTDVAKTMQRIAQISGIVDPGSVHPQVARHTFITEARRQGYVVEAIQRAVGHRHPYDTEKYGLPLVVLEHSPAYKVAAIFEAAGVVLPEAS